MLHFFPAGFPDETLYGRLARYHRLSGHSDDRASLIELVGLHTHVITSDLPSLLQTLVSRIPQAGRPSTQELVRTNTIFPYFEAFLPAERSSRAIEKMSSASSSGLKMALGLVASRLGGRNVFRFCRGCVGDDACDHGQAYWHRTHQLPGSWVCPVHCEVLCELDLSVAHLKRHKLFLPDDSIVELNSSPISLSKREAEAVGRISALSSEMLMAKQNWNLRDLHRSNAARNGLVRRSGRIRVQELTDMLVQYSASLPARAEYSILCRRPLEWALKLLRKPRGGVLHPMKHILLMDCLRGESVIWDRENKTPIAREQPRQGQLRRHISESELVEMLGEKKLTLTRAAAELGLSVTTIGIEAARVGLSVRGRRPKLITDDVKVHVSQSLRDGLELQEVARKHKLSLVSVYRILRMNEALSAEYARLRFQQRREEYRKRFSTQERIRAVYSWLRRHDREWLSEQLAAGKKRKVERKPCVDWAERDKLWAQKVVEASEVMRSFEGKPKWISRATLVRTLAKADTIKRNAERLPMTHAALSSCAEQLADYQRRRLYWAAGELQKQLMVPLQPWRLLRLAGIRRLAQPNEDLLKTLTSSRSILTDLLNRRT